MEIFCHIQGEKLGENQSSNTNTCINGRNKHIYSRNRHFDHLLESPHHMAEQDFIAEYPLIRSFMFYFNDEISHSRNKLVPVSIMERELAPCKHILSLSN